MENLKSFAALAAAAGITPAPEQTQDQQKEYLWAIQRTLNIQAGKNYKPSIPSKIYIISDEEFEILKDARNKKIIIELQDMPEYGGTIRYAYVPLEDYLDPMFDNDWDVEYDVEYYLPKEGEYLMNSDLAYKIYRLSQYPGLLPFKEMNDEYIKTLHKAVEEEINNNKRAIDHYNKEMATYNIEEERYKKAIGEWDITTAMVKDIEGDFNNNISSGKGVIQRINNFFATKYQYISTFFYDYVFIIPNGGYFYIHHNDHNYEDFCTGTLLEIYRADGTHIETLFHL